MRSAFLPTTRERSGIHALSTCGSVAPASKLGDAVAPFQGPPIDGNRHLSTPTGIYIMTIPMSTSISTSTSISPLKEPLKGATWTPLGIGAPKARAPPASRPLRPPGAPQLRGRLPELTLLMVKILHHPICTVCYGCHHDSYRSDT